MPHESVILLHGLCRTARSTRPMAQALAGAGYSVVNIDYPSRSASILELAESTIPSALKSPEVIKSHKIHFVTHSMGGILLRSFLSRHKIKGLGRVVMLSPPNQGSEVVDNLKGVALFQWLNGPAGQELGTDENSTPNRLGGVDFELGVITGDRSINWINSLMIAGPDDGKVSVARTKVQGMREHIVLHVVHPLIMRSPQVQSAALQFLSSGRFENCPKSVRRATN